MNPCREKICHTRCPHLVHYNPIEQVRSSGIVAGASMKLRMGYTGVWQILTVTTVNHLDHRVVIAANAVMVTLSMKLGI